MSDPVSISTAIIALSEMLARIIHLLDDFVNGKQRIREIRDDCVVTKKVLDHIRERLDPEESEVPPITPIDGTQTSDDITRTKLCNNLMDIVKQLELDIDVLETQLAHLRDSGHRNRRIRQPLQRVQIAWKLQHLNKMHQKIMATREGLLKLILITLTL